MSSDPTFQVDVDPANPGQFFACCGLLELADRLWPGAEGWFSHDSLSFHVAAMGTLSELVNAIGHAELKHVDSDDATSGRIEIGSPFRPIRIDWWHLLGGRANRTSLKVWAGSMESFGIARAMQAVLQDERFRTPELFDIGMVVPDPDQPKKKKEPFYFDSRRAPNSHSRDVGFSANTLGLTTVAYPAVEFLCLVGLQRCWPRPHEKKARVFDYFLWNRPASPELLPPLVAGQIPAFGISGFRFENWYRTGQKKHKAFRPANPLFNEATSEQAK